MIIMILIIIIIIIIKIILILTLFKFFTCLFPFSANKILYYIDTSVLLENIPLAKFIKTTSGTRVVYFP